MTVQEYLSQHPDIMIVHPDILVVHHSDITTLCVLCVVLGVVVTILGRWIGTWIVRRM